MRGGKIVVILDYVDAAVVGATLRMLGKMNKSSDESVGDRLFRVGTELQLASLNEVIADDDVAL